MSLAEQLILENLKTKNPYLDLGNCGLDGTEPELQLLEQCTHLETLVFSNWWYDFDMEKFKLLLESIKLDVEDHETIKCYSQNEGEPNKLTFLPACLPLSLQKLVLANNQLSDISAVGKLNKLTVLNLDNNQLSDISDVDKLNKLTVLNLDNNQLSDISAVGKLTKLTVLALRDNQLSDISTVGKLTKLNFLALNENQLSDISAVGKLTELNFLALYDNQLSDISAVSKLTELIALSLEDNQLSDISAVGKLSKLTFLNLANNQLSDISAVGKLTELTVLDLHDNQLSDISAVGKLTELTILNLGTNQIQQFPPEFLGKLERLYLADNPIENIPTEYFDKKESWGSPKNVLTEVRDYFQSIANAEDRRELNEAKLIIAGVGEVGKSELVEALSTKEYSFEAGRASTQGIQIRQWLMPCTREGKDITFRTNIWDLAGQNENYHTHQFFLTKNSVYVFVWNARVNTDEANQFEYWLGVISLLSDNAPILVVQNKIDQNEGAGTNERDWREKFPHIVGFYKTSCKTGTGIDDLRKAVQDTLLSLPNTREIWNKHRFAVREALEQRKEDYISIEQYHQLCAEHSLTDEQARFLASQLHDIGVMLYYAHDESLCDTVVLKSEWTVAAAYCLIDTQKVRAGRFQKQDLPTIWQDKRFTHKRPYLLELMKRFELIFQFQDSDTYIVPEGLPTEEPQSLTPNPSPKERGLHTLSFGEGKGEAFLRFEYHYKFMPKGILSRLICRVHQYILGEWFWRYGVVLEDKEGNQARIVLNEVERVLKITVQGEKPAYLLRIIRHHTEAIHHNLKNPPLEEKVPCMCVECRQDKNPYLHNYATLKKFQEKGRTTRECEKSAEVADIAQMLEGILDTKKGQTKILFDLIDRANVSGFFMEIERLGVSGNQIASLRKEYIHDGGNFQYADKLKVWVMDYFS